MKSILFLLLFLGAFFCARADHITGGEMFYTYAGFANGLHKYNVTLKLFMRCNAGRVFSNPTYVMVFEKVTNRRIDDIAVGLSSQETISTVSANPCITDPPTVCYVVGYYTFTLPLAASVYGYLLASQVNYRIAGINNLASNYGLIGATYTAEVPPTAAAENSSAHFTGTDLVTICADNAFSYSFAAGDGDGDRLHYSFCDAYISGGGGTPGNATPPSGPPYESVPYGRPEFDNGAPLGARVSIDAGSGLITGVAPGEGKYVVTVCVEEIRGGQVIATQRKDLQINIASCTIAAASLPARFLLCRESKTLAVYNQSNSPLIKTYDWLFTNTAGLPLFSSTSPAPNYTFPDTGRYTVKLVINRGLQCADSSAAPVLVYPGIKAGFDAAGGCVNKPTSFIDRSGSVYGVINSWTWSFGQNGQDISTQQNPVYTYPGTGVKTVRLIAGDSKGCVDTLLKDITILNKAILGLAFRDTLICIPDKLQLQAYGSGSFSWSPAPGMLNANTAAPTVAPVTSTWYYVEVNYDGCKNNDSVQVRVVDHVSLQAMPDTVICRGDAIRLRLLSNGLHYSWTPAGQLVDPTLPAPTTLPAGAGAYQVTAVIGSCSATDDVLVTAVPYPQANAGPDTTICFNTPARLHGDMDGSSLLWTPPSTLSNAAVLQPLARPLQTTAYVLHAYDTRGCPKPGTDTVVVTVLPDIRAWAGHDTAVVVGQPLQLEAKGGVQYVWSPPAGLSSATIYNPVGLYTAPNAGISYKVLVYNEAGCVDSAYITVKVYKTLPSVFVPNAFTPNADGHNELLRPVAVGIRSLEYFRIYNRWGQLVFSSADTESGWNGSLNGKAQEPGAYVWMVKAVDYLGESHVEKGTVLLLR